MPGPGNKRKTKVATHARAKESMDKPTDVVEATFTHTDAFPQQCLTLMDDEITRCGRIATEGDSNPERCKVHHGQYCILYKKYRDATKVVDDMKGSLELPTKEQIDQYTDWHVALEKARCVRKYLEAMRVEREGRNIHCRRFFLKVDDGHRRRLRLLDNETEIAVHVLDALQTKAYGLYQPDSILHTMNNRELSKAEKDLEKRSKQTTEMLRQWVRNPNTSNEWSTLIPRLITRKEHMMRLLGPWINLGPGAVLETRWFIHQQFARRIIFHEPTLFMKSLGRISFNDLMFSDDFSMEDLARFVDLSVRHFEFPLRWFKDSVLDVLDITRDALAPNFGSTENRFPLLGGWVYNRSHTADMTNECWWLLLETLRPPVNAENYFIRLCNNFDDLTTLLSFQVFGLVPNPSFCPSLPQFDADDPCLSRNHLSLSGVIVADVCPPFITPYTHVTMPMTRRATRRDRIIATEIEMRAHMFGAIRNERDGFVEAFLRELRARPDLFQVVLRSETDPGRKVETFGSGHSNSEALPAVRAHHYVELRPSSSSAATMRDEWEVLWSAVDVLYGKWEELHGQLAAGRDDDKQFFRFKRFPVTYFVILDTVPGRPMSVLTRNVAWAALRAGGYAEGEYTLRKYAAAADNLLDKCAQERLGWMPKEMWRITKMQDKMGSTWTCNLM